MEEEKSPLTPDDSQKETPTGNAIRVEYVRAIVAIVGVLSAVMLSAYRADNTVVATLGVGSISAFFGYSSPPRDERP